MATLEQITREAQSLTPEEQIKLVDAILAELHGIDPEIEREWAALADARYEAYQRGEIVAQDWEEIRAKLLGEIRNKLPG